MVGATGFEPATSWSQTTRSTKLSYAPNDQCHNYRKTSLMARELIVPKSARKRDSRKNLPLMRPTSPAPGATSVFLCHFGSQTAAFRWMANDWERSFS